MRYSPRPIDDYGRRIAGKWYGPAMFTFLKDDPEGWNLAYLSFDWDKRPVHPNEQFTILVRRTVQTRLDTGELDMAGVLKPPLLVRSLLRLPAPQFVKIVSESPILAQLPLYTVLGPHWLKTITTRSRLCAAVDDVPDNDVDSLVDAEKFIALLRSRK